MSPSPLVKGRFPQRNESRQKALVIREMGNGPRIRGAPPSCVSYVTRIDCALSQTRIRTMEILGKLRIIATVMAAIPVIWCGLQMSGCRTEKQEAWEIAPLGQDQVEQVVLEDQAILRIDRIRFYSREMDGPKFFLALVPKNAKAIDRVWILNHGWADRPETILAALKIDQVYSRLLSEGKVQPAVLVLPDVRFPDYFRRHADSYPFPQYLILVAEEVARTVSSKYNIPFSRDTWGIGGFSFGGYLSLDVGRRYSGRFGSVSAVSTFFDEEWTFWPSSPPPPGEVDALGRGKQTIVIPGPVPRLFLACGTSDSFYGIMVELHKKFQQLGIPHEWSTGPGAHTWSYWSTVLEGMFIFHLGKGMGENPHSAGSGGE